MMGGGMPSRRYGGSGWRVTRYGATPTAARAGHMARRQRPAAAAGAQPTQYFQCVTQYGQCSFASSPGAVRSGGACTCTNGHRGKIK